MGSDLASILWWWVVFLFLGTSSLPLSWILFRKNFDLGYGFSKILGLVISSYILFLGGITKILPFTQFTALSSLILVYLANYLIFKNKKKEILTSFSERKRTIILQEFLFIFGLVFWSYIRAHQPDIRGLEKFMDFGFINSILRSKYLPPADMWFSGLPINYYWFGHYMVAFVTKLSKIPSPITYNLALATILGLALTGAFSIVTSLVSSLNNIKNLRLIALSGIISAIILSFGGNFHTPFFVLKNGAEKYWYPDATRFIGYNPDVNDKTIHEFPLYSYVVSDLHAHLINFPVVLLYIGLLWSFISTHDSARNNPKARKPPFGLWNSVIGHSMKKSFSELIFPVSLGFILGIMFMTNTWDFGNYFLLTGITLTTFTLWNSGFGLNNLPASIKKVSIYIVTTLAAAAVVIFPFIINFESLAEGVKLVHTHTPLWQLVILWGFPFVLTSIYILVLKLSKVKLKKPDVLVVSLFLTSWILIALPEIIYVKDIYIASHYRANTMFKLTYQAFVMFYLSSGYIFARTLTALRDKLFRKILLMGFALLFFLIITYPYFAINSYYGNLKVYTGLKGDVWLTQVMPEQYSVINWLNSNVDGQPNILEAHGDSYTDYNVISSYTGLPTVSGWFVHEWLWRGDPSFPQGRVSDISQIYTQPNLQFTKTLLDKYNIKYVIVGPFERERYPNLNEIKFSQLGTRVFTVGTTSIYQIK